MTKYPRSEKPKVRTIFVRESIRAFMETHLGCSSKEISFATGFTPSQVQDAVAHIRLEWTSKVKPSTSDSEAVERAMAAIQRQRLR